LLGLGKAAIGGGVNTVASKVDIVIRAKNGHALTADCILSIKSNTPPGSYRIILVDDGSDPIYPQMDQDYTVRSDVSSGAVTATNLGLQIALALDGDSVVIFDNDTRVPDGDTTWLERWVTALNEQPDTACVGATTNYANPPQHILACPQTYTADWQDDKAGKWGVKDGPAVVWFISCAVLFRKDVIRRLGLWDERFNPGNWEDTDYAMRVRDAGYAIRVAQSVYIHHEGHKTFSDDLQRLLVVNGQKFRAKWGLGKLYDMGIVQKAELMKHAR